MKIKNKIMVLDDLTVLTILYILKVREHLSKGKSLKCHHKNCNNKEFHSLEAYNNHCHSKHPKQPMYPELSLIKMMNLEPKGNPWE